MGQERGRRPGQAATGGDRCHGGGRSPRAGGGRVASGGPAELPLRDSLRDGHRHVQHASPGGTRPDSLPCAFLLHLLRAVPHRCRLRHPAYRRVARGDEEAQARPGCTPVPDIRPLLRHRHGDKRRYHGELVRHRPRDGPELARVPEESAPVRSPGGADDLLHTCHRARLHPGLARARHPHGRRLPFGQALERGVCGRRVDAADAIAAADGGRVEEHSRRARRRGLRECRASQRACGQEQGSRPRPGHLPGAYLRGEGPPG